jgi:hypothetical protein
MENMLQKISLYKLLNSILHPCATDLLKQLKKLFKKNPKIFSSDCKIEFYEFVKPYVDQIYKDYSPLTEDLTIDTIVSKFQTIMNFYKNNNFIDYEWVADDDIIITIDLSKLIKR